MLQKTLLNVPKQHPIIPVSVDKKLFVDNLGTFFNDKVVKIHCDIQSSMDSVTRTEDTATGHTSIPPPDITFEVLSEFKPLSGKDVEKLIMKSKKKIMFS